MARCNDCNRFVGYSDEEPEVQTEDFDYDEETGDVTLNIEIRRALCCDQCGTELKEASFIFDQTYERGLGTGLDKDSIEMTVEAENWDTYKGKGRGMKTFYGVRATVTLSKIVQGESRDLLTETLEDTLQASYYDEC